MRDLRDELEELDGVWEGAEVTDGGDYDSLPDGTYQVKVEEVCFDHARKSGDLMYVFTFEVITGEHTGRKIWHRRMLSNPDGVKYLKQDIHRLGLDVDRISLLPQYHEQLLDRIAEVRLKSSSKEGKTYQNCYVNKLLVDAMPAAADDELPF